MIKPQFCTVDRVCKALARGTRAGASALIAFALATAASTAAPPARAASPVVTTTPRESRYWSRRWRRVNTVDYVWTSVTASAVLFEGYLYLSGRPPLRWSQPVLFDSAVRDALLLSSGSAKSAVDVASWVIFLGSMAYPIVVDVPVAAARGGKDLAWQFFWQDVLVLTTTAAIDLGIREIVGRARPSTTKCLDAGGGGCLDSRESTRSFPNGHFAMGSAMAALICVQHLNTGLYGGPWDAVTCASALAANASMGVMRIMVDAHWATDTIVGGALGTLTGWLLPTLLYYRNGSSKLPSDTRGKGVRATSTTASGPSVIPMPFVVSGGLGFNLTGLL